MGASRQRAQTMSEKYQETHGEDENSHRSCEGAPSGSGIIDIDSKGGLLLNVKHYNNDSGQVYRVSVAVLRKASAYFDTLLDPAKFSEGAAVRTRLVELTKVYAEAESMPASDLPCVAISDIGQVPKAKISEAAFKLFLDILHHPKASLPTPQIHFISILALVADRFDATTPISSYILEHDWKKKLAKQDKSHKSELRLNIFRRQKVLIGLILGFQDWVYQYSSELIYQGLEKGTSDSTDFDEEPWWNLPHGVEEELTCRRVCLFETLGSMQSHFLHLYSRSSKQPQCRLGYDSSWQCDSFQLGEMIRYFTRRGTLSMQNTFTHLHDTPQFAGSVEDLVSILQQCPAYQIDKNHSHCGARTRLEPALKSTVPALTRSGICLHCWKRNRGEDSWLENPIGGEWHLGKPRLSRLFQGCPDHRTIKALCTADDRDWTPPHG